MDIQILAKAYIDAGWSVVPLVKGEKRAATKWQSKTYKPEDFKPDDGIAGKCGKPSEWRVDVDLDSVEAIAAAKMLLPATGLVHGRPCKPDSHYWFICDGIKTSQFTDVKNSAGKTGMLVEIRSTGGYTALPPSTHPSGDVLAWSVERDAMNMTPEDLYAAVRDVALTALLARHWPGAGQPHAMIGPLAGFLCQGGVINVSHIIRAAATIAGEPADDVRDRVNFAQSTIAKYRADKDAPLTGGPKLAAIIGEDVVAKMRGWLRLADNDAIVEMNEKHFVVRIGKDELIATEDHDEVFFQYRRALDLRYANRKINVGVDEEGKPQIKPLIQAWLESPTRREFRQLTFAPPPILADPRDYNLWKGFAVTAQAGDCSLLLSHLHNIICSGIPEHSQYLMKLLAFTVQFPGIPSEVAVVMRGEPGTGKGFFVRAISNIFGRHACHLDKVDQLVGHFNAMLSSKVIVFADEAFWAGDKREVGALKRLITEPTLSIERKGLDAVEEHNCVHLFMATNEEWSIPAMLKERRFFALNVSSDRRQDIAYFGALDAELKAGGLGAFLELLLRIPVTQDEVLRVPLTAELRIQQDQSLSIELKWWQECLVNEQIGAVAWAEWMNSVYMYDSYKVWSKDFGARVLNAIEFARRMGKFFSAKPKTQPHRVSGQVERCWELYRIDNARLIFDAELGTKSDWPIAPGVSSSSAIPF